MKTETFDNPADFLAALGGKKRTPAKEARPGLPRAESVERVGLSGLIAGKDRTWNYEYSVLKGHRLYVQNSAPPLDTGFHLDLAAACAVAKGMRQ